MPDNMSPQLARQLKHKIACRMHEPPMTTRKFLIQYEFDPSQTRWLFDRGEEERILKLVAENVAQAHTTGPRPRVTVRREEVPYSEPAPMPACLTHG